MARTRFIFATLITVAILWPGCDTGLSPLNEPSGFSGVVRFKNWPVADSVRDLRLVAFESFPSDSAGILLTLLSGRAAVYPANLTAAGSLPKFVDSVAFEFTTDSKQGINLKVQQYGYVIIAQLYGPNSFTDWRPAGVYTTTPNSFDPAPIRILLHKTTPDVDIQVDFHNPPPKPWR